MNATSNDSSNWLVHDHRNYEAALAECELAAGAGDWKEAVQLFYDFAESLKVHMRMEDEVLFPLFKSRGDPEGAIDELIEEHEDIVRLMHDLAYVIKRNDYDHFFESLAPLRKVMTEHNGHEEDVFLRLSGEQLPMAREEILKQLDAVQTREGRRVWNI